MAFCQNLKAQCPEGQRQTFWHPSQIDSFKLLYPNCNEFNFQTRMVNGEYVKPKFGTAKDKFQYLIALISILILILCILKIVTSKIEYFKD